MRSIVGIFSLFLLVFFAADLAATPSLPPRLAVVISDSRRAEVETILANPTFVRQLDFQVLGDRRVYTFLLDHPDLNAALARALHIAPYQVVNTGPGQYHGDDGQGNVGTVEIFNADGNTRAFLERGVSHGWWFGDIGGRVVALVVLSPEEERVRGTITVWARIDQGMVDRLLRTLKPILGGLLDRKLREQLNISVKVAEAVAQHPELVCPLLEEESAGSPDTRRALAGFAGCS